VDGILHSTMTLLYGEAKAGKSTLAAAMVAAMVNGEHDFLGKVIEPKRYSAGIIAADFGDDQAYGAQLCRVLRDEAVVPVYALDRPPDRRVWEGLQLAARQERHDLIVVDNLTAFVGGSLNDDIPVNKLYDELDRFVRDGTAVLLVAHSSEKSGERGKSPFPIGSSAIRARARWTWRAERRAADTRLTFSGNYAAEHEITVSLANGMPRFDVIASAGADVLADRRAKRTRQRSEARTKTADAIREYVLIECQQMNGKQTAEAIAAKFGGSVSSYQSQLSRKSLGVKAIDGGGWESCLHAA
jgi:hypothetical protein